VNTGQKVGHWEKLDWEKEQSSQEKRNLPESTVNECGARKKVKTFDRKNLSPAEQTT